VKANKYAKFKADDSALMYNMLITAGMSVIIFFALMNIGTYINGTIAGSLIDSYPSTATDRSRLQNMTVNSLENITEDYDDVLDIATTTAIIMVIILPLAAVIAVRKLI